MRRRFYSAPSPSRAAGYACYTIGGPRLKRCGASAAPVTQLALHPAHASLVAMVALCASAAPATGTDALPGIYAPGPGTLTRIQRDGLAGIVHDRLDARTTASGELYNRGALTAAHRSLPFGTLVRVTNVQNKRSVVVRINDRASAAGNRLIDLTPRAAAAIGLQGIAVAEVRLEVMGQGAPRLAPPDGADAAPAVK